MLTSSAMAVLLLLAQDYNAPGRRPGPPPAVSLSDDFGTDPDARWNWTSTNYTWIGSPTFEFECGVEQTAAIYDTPTSTADQCVCVDLANTAQAAPAVGLRTNTTPTGGANNDHFAVGWYSGTDKFYIWEMDGNAWQRDAYISVAATADDVIGEGDRICAKVTGSDPAAPVFTAYYYEGGASGGAQCDGSPTTTVCASGCTTTWTSVSGFSTTIPATNKRCGIISLSTGNAFDNWTCKDI